MSFIEKELNHQVLVLKLNRPEMLNSFHREMALMLQNYLDEAQSNEEIRAVLLTGNGRAFCAGQDLQEATSAEGPALQRIVKEHYNPIIEKIRNLKKPVICAVNGVAAGAGANIALACDVVIATQSASFIQAFSKIGLIPDSGGTFTLPRLVGLQKATALMMLGDKISATDAEKMNMIYAVTEDEKLMEHAIQTAQKLAQMPTHALWLTKYALNQSVNNSLTAQLELEEQLQTQAGASYDYNEGVNAFLEKRKPNFKGK